MSGPSRPADRGGRTAEVFAAFLKLGLTSFGGPVAHLGYFRDEFVARRRWLGDAAYAELVALCQFLPGPASSQVGFALGYQRAGLAGALLAWAAFTLPSVGLLLAFAAAAGQFDHPLANAAIHGLKLVAVAVVAQAVWAMGRSLVPDRPRAAIMLAALCLVTLLPAAAGQPAALVAGALAGLFCCRGTVADLGADSGSDSGSDSGAEMRAVVSRRTGWVLLGLFAGLLFGLPALLAAWPSAGLALFDLFYRAGALVFGGGHVVLPLLEAGLVPPGWVDSDSFVAGYGAAQAVPGPLFTFAAYLGFINGLGPSGLSGAAIALAGIFLPGLLLVIGALPFWRDLAGNPAARGAVAGANAAVVGLLAAALYSPVWNSAVASGLDFAIAVTAFLLLATWRTPPWLVVVATVSASVAAHAFAASA
jgi:chromate transporter